MKRRDGNKLLAILRWRESGRERKEGKAEEVKEGMEAGTSKGRKGRKD